MKKKEIQDLKVKSEAELIRLVKDTNEKLRALRFDLAAGKVKNVSELRNNRKLVARAKTLLREKTVSQS
jgi:large subunit ribosomal protein L29